MLEHAIVKFHWWHVVLGIGLGIGVGRLTSGGTGASAGEKQTEGKGASFAGSTKIGDRAAMPPQSSHASAITAIRRDLAKASSDHMPALVYRALEISDPNERWLILTEMLSRLDESNCMAVMDEYVRITRETGRMQHAEWLQALYAIGQKGGAVAMNAWKERKELEETKQSWHTMLGWASADPQAAKDWIDQPGNLTPNQQARMRAALLEGVAISDPERAIKMLEEFPENERRRPMPGMLDSIIQKEGLDRAVDWMLEAKKNGGDNPGDYARNLENQVYQKIFSAAQLTGGAPEMAARLKAINDVSPIPPQRLASLANQMPGVSGLDLLNHLGKSGMNDSGELQQVTSQLVRSVYRKSPEEVHTWLENHVDSPLHDEIQAGVEAVSGTAQ